MPGSSVYTHGDIPTYEGAEKVLGAEGANELKNLRKSIQRSRERELIVCMNNVPEDNEGDLMFSNGIYFTCVYIPVYVCLCVCTYMHTYIHKHTYIQVSHSQAYINSSTMQPAA